MVTIILIAVTCLVSILCFTGTLNANKLLFHAYSVWHRKEWYRMLTYGAVHGGWGHLFFNMLILFASILFEPKMGIYIYLIPIPVPGYIFAPLYLLYCWYMAKRNQDNIGHTAHFWGAVYGLLFPLVCRPDIFQHFLIQLGL